MSFVHPIFKKEAENHIHLVARRDCCPAVADHIPHPELADCVHHPEPGDCTHRSGFGDCIHLRRLWMVVAHTHLVRVLDWPRTVAVRCCLQRLRILHYFGHSSLERTDRQDLHPVVAAILYHQGLRTVPTLRQWMVDQPLELDCLDRHDRLEWCGRRTCLALVINSSSDRVLMLLDLIHSGNGFFGFCLLCISDETKPATTVCIAIFDNNLKN